MSKHRKRHWHFTIRTPRRMFDETPPEPKVEFIPESTRIVLKAPEIRISIPIEVERAVVPPPPSKDELVKSLREWRNMVRIMRHGEAQGVFSKEDLWTAEWQLEKLRSQVGEVNPDGSRVKHPGPLKSFLDMRFKELQARVRDP